MYRHFAKHIFDFVASFIFIIMFGWLFIIIAIMVKIKLGSPVVFCQERPGKDEKIFKIYKFRTMTNEKDEKGNLLPDLQRLTSFGRLLRDTSLDELPEFFCVLNGSMSIVGPRPLLVKYLDKYTSEQHRRHEVKPGITGLAQISGRNELDWDERFKLDVEYVDKISFKMDMEIIFKTIYKVFLRKDINSSSESNITMHEFNGVTKE